MNILQIAPQIPLPLSDGGKVGIYNITKHLAELGHNITFLCFDRDKNLTDVSMLTSICNLETVTHSTDNRVLPAIINLFDTKPYNISKYYSNSVYDKLETIITKSSFDVVHVDHLHMAHYGVFCKERYGLPIVLREHNIESTIVMRYAATAKNTFIKKYLDLQYRRIFSYESRITQKYDVCAVITPDDEKRLLEMQPLAKTKIVPGGVHNMYFAGIDTNSIQPKTISFFGGFDWIPNQDALEWFLQKIMPIVIESEPEAKFFVIGKKVPPALKRYESKNVIFKGFVEDLKSEVQKYEVTIAPFRIGGGIRLKILESFAMRVPVVSTKVGCEGIECDHNKSIMIGDTEADFAQCILNLFSDKQLKTHITDKAYSIAKEKYTWHKVAMGFENIYKSIVK